MQDTFKQYFLPEKSGFDSLTIREAVKQSPKYGQILVRIKAVSLNWRDGIIAEGTYPFPGPDALVPGSDGAGTATPGRLLRRPVLLLLITIYTCLRLQVSSKKSARALLNGKSATGSWQTSLKNILQADLPPGRSSPNWEVKPRASWANIESARRQELYASPTISRSRRRRACPVLRSRLGTHSTA